MLPGRLVVPLRVEAFNFKNCQPSPFLQKLLDPVIVGGWRELVCPQADGLLDCRVGRVKDQGPDPVGLGARAFRLPLLVDVVGQASVVEMLASEYSDVNFIIPHLGSFRDDWRAHQKVVDQIAHFPNVFTDTSGVRRFDYIVEAIKRAGPHKVLFGSDGPWLHPGLELYKIRLLHLPPEQEALILGGNVLRLLRQVRIPGVAAQPSRSYGYTGIKGPEGVARRTDHIVTERLPPGTQLEYEL